LSYNIPFISLMLAILSGIICPFFKDGRATHRFICGVQLLIACISAILLTTLWQTGESFTFVLGHFPAPWGNELRAGALEALLALAFSIVMLLSLLGGAQDLYRDIRPDRQGQFCMLMQLLYGALLALVYTNDLFTAYVFLEIGAITACIAVVAKQSGKSIVAAIRYLIFSCLGSGLVLLGISILYAITGHLLMRDLNAALIQLTATGQYAVPLTASALLMTLGLAIKSAQFPFHAWLPDAHASATTSASAILSGLVLKGYIVLLIKLIIRVFGASVIIKMYMHDLLFLLGLAGMLFASAAALRQEDVKRMIAYSSSAQISYIFLALGLGSRAGTAAACFQILAHAFTKSMIFISAGALIHASGGGHYWRDLRGALWRDPLAGLGFAVGALSLCGLPLLAGFSAKYTLAVAGLTGDWHTLPTLFGLAISSVLNAMYYIPALLAIFGVAGQNATEGAQTGGTVGVRLAIVCFMFFNLALGVGVGPIMDLIYIGLDAL
jgi:multicomponent Na+:H+ antiporter subunit D